MTSERAGARLARYRFANRERAGGLLGPTGLAWWDPTTQRPVDDRAGALLTRLAESADPDLALLQLHRLRAAQPTPTTSVPPDPSGPGRAVGAALAGGDLVETLLGDEEFAKRLVAVLGASAALGDHLVACPGDWAALVDGEFPAGRRDAAALHDELRAAVAGTTGPKAIMALRGAYRRALLALAAADLAGERDVEEVMAELADLADATLGAALAVAEAELPPTAPPARLAVIAMGKCGAGELNYVSDVDVVFVAGPVDPDGDVDGALRTAGTLARRLIEICRQVAWQVDAALRPEGRDGPLVRTVASYRAYYQKWARTWEFQALLKARPAAGDADLAAGWLDLVRPMVWQADGAARPGMVEEVRAMRRRVEDRLSPADAEREIKLGRGGLRDIEFAVQLLQLVHGRADEALRDRATLPALRALTAGGYVGRTDGEALDRAYRFLRTVEHRLQLQHLRRTHRVPDDEAALRWLAQALGYRADARGDAVQAFQREWSAQAHEVRRLHEKLLYRPLLAAVARVPTDELRLTPEAAGQRLAALGFADPAAALRHLAALTGGVSRTAAIQRALLPAMLSEFADGPEPDRGLLAYRKVSEKLGRTPWYLRLLRDSGPVALRLARLLGTSRYVTDLLQRDPEALRLLADDRELVPRDAAELRASMTAAASRYRRPADAVTAVRAQRRRELLRIACADLLGRLDADGVGRALSDVCDSVLAAALQVARFATDAPPELRFTIVGMGRLGGCELSYASDADVLFVYEGAGGAGSDGAASPAAAGGAGRVRERDEDSAAAHAVAERLRMLLSAPAPDPPLQVDAGLRPEGRQGPLVRSLAAYTSYYGRWSRTWEAQALLRARVVAGDGELGERFLAMADRVRYPREGLAPEQVMEIRRIKARVDSERLPRGADPATHTKLGRGGLTDVEWTVQLLQLEHSGAVPALRTPRTLAALAAARGAHLLTGDEEVALREAWLLASRVRNAMMLVRGRPSDQLPRHGVELAGVIRALAFADADPGAFLDQYLRTARHARQVVVRYLEADPGTGPARRNGPVR